MDQHPLMIIMFGAIALLILYNTPGSEPAIVTTSTAGDVPDMWGTPYYLRYNTSIYDTTKAVMPLSPAYTYGLGVPGPSYGQRQLTITGTGS